jgi:hypothetical protein
VNPIGDLLLVIEPLFHVDLYVTYSLNIVPRVEFLSCLFYHNSLADVEFF